LETRLKWRGDGLRRIAPQQRLQITAIEQIDFLGFVQLATIGILLRQF
jgi:hypothetical protein